MENHEHGISAAGAPVIAREDNFRRVSCTGPADFYWHGRPAIVTAHRVYHETNFKDCRLKTDEIAIRPLTADVAIAVVTYTQDTFTTPAGEVVKKHQNKLSHVFTRVAGAWKIAHGQNVRIDASAAQYDPVNAPGKKEK